MPTNDNNPPGSPAGPPTEVHGQAALLLVESLIHGLCENETLTAAEAVAIADRAASVQSDVATAADGDARSIRRSHALLAAIAVSLRTETRRGAPLRPVP